MSTDDLDTATLAEYRRVIEQAAATSPNATTARAAVSHVFAALDRGDEMLAIIRDVAKMNGVLCTCRPGDHARCPVIRARALLAR